MRNVCNIVLFRFRFILSFSCTKCPKQKNVLDNGFFQNLYWRRLSPIPLWSGLGATITDAFFVRLLSRFACLNSPNMEKDRAELGCYRL
jgi:hypothetical protein